MSEAIARYHIASYLLGSDEEWSGLEEGEQEQLWNGIGLQLEKLRQFADQYPSRYEGAPKQFKARVKLYAPAIKAPWWEGQTYGLPLPAQPGDGTTQCITHCNCRWEINQLDGEGNYDCYWRLGASEEHCQTCNVRARRWSPLKIRDGIIVSTKAMCDSCGEPVALKDTWRTIAGHAICLDCSGSGGGKGGQGQGGGAASATSSPDHVDALADLKRKADAKEMPFSDYIAEVRKVSAETGKPLPALLAEVTNRASGTKIEPGSPEWADKAYSSWNGSLSPKERSAVHAYTGPEFMNINGALRSSEAGTPSAKVKGQIKALDTALGRSSAPEEFTTYRAMHHPELERMMHEGTLTAGSTFNDAGYSSTTLRRDRLAKVDRPIQAVITVRKGAKGGYIAPHSTAPEDAEFLTTRGSTFRVKSYKRAKDAHGKDIWELHLEYGD